MQVTPEDRAAAKEVAVHLARKMIQGFLADLTRDALTLDDCCRAIIVCQGMRNEDGIKEEIAEFMKLADEKTDGVFSATLNSANAGKRH